MTAQIEDEAELTREARTAILRKIATATELANPGELMQLAQAYRQLADAAD